MSVTANPTCVTANLMWIPANSITMSHTPMLIGHNTMLPCPNSMSIVVKTNCVAPIICQGTQPIIYYATILCVSIDLNT